MYISVLLSSSLVAEVTWRFRDKDMLFDVTFDILIKGGKKMWLKLKLINKSEKFEPNSFLAR